MIGGWRPLIPNYHRKSFILFQIAVKHEELKVIMHPVIQQLIRTKWEQFGQYKVVFKISVYLLYLSLWTILAGLLPENPGDIYTTKANTVYWRLPLEVLCMGLTLYFLIKVRSFFLSFLCGPYT